MNNITIIGRLGADADSSEMVSQVLFGEKVEVLEELEKWSKVRLAFDGYEGWVMYLNI